MKLVLVVRTDLGMGRRKNAAQVVHAPTWLTPGNPDPVAAGLKCWHA
jgi:hypothetical protein